MINVQKPVFATACLFKINDLINSYCFKRNTILKKYFTNIENEWENIKLILNTPIKNNIMLMDSQYKPDTMQDSISSNTELNLNPSMIDFLNSLITKYNITIDDSTYTFSDPPYNTNGINTWSSIENIYLEMINIHKQIIIYQTLASLYYGTDQTTLSRTPAQLTPFLNFNVPLNYDVTLYFSETSASHLDNCIDSDFIFNLISESPEDFLDETLYTLSTEKISIESKPKITHTDGANDYPLYIFEYPNINSYKLFMINKLTTYTDINVGNIIFYDDTSLSDYIKSHREIIISPIQVNYISDGVDTYNVGLNSFVVELNMNSTSAPDTLTAYAYGLKKAQFL